LGHTGVRVQETAHRLAQARIVSARAPGFAAQRGVGARAQEQRHHLSVLPVASQHQSGVAVRILRVHIGAGRQKLLRDSGVAAARAFEQRRVAVCIPRINLQVAVGRVSGACSSLRGLPPVITCCARQLGGAPAGPHVANKSGGR
jgi:hypothetical protein